MSDRPSPLEAYEELAEAYAALIDTKPHNAYYERPATLSLLPEVTGLRVLDAGCGPGVYSEWLIANGAEVVSIDASPKMVNLANQRLGGGADVRLADLGKPLDLGNSTFDVVLAPLVMDYIKNWQSTFEEFFRILKTGGRFVFSASHPFSDYLYFQSENYLQTEAVGSVWRGFRPLKVFVPSYRRPLSGMFGPLTAVGFKIEKIVEPMPTEEFKTADPKHYEELSRMPAFICIRAIK